MKRVLTFALSAVVATMAFAPLASADVVVTNTLSIGAVYISPDSHYVWSGAGLYDTQTQTTIPVSSEIVDASGQAGDQGGTVVGLSGDYRYEVIRSTSTNLSPDYHNAYTNGTLPSFAYVRDRQTGSITLVNPFGLVNLNGIGVESSADTNVLLFEGWQSTASGSPIHTYVYNRQTGASVQLPDNIQVPSLSQSGNLVTYDIVTHDPAGNYATLYLYNVSTGATTNLGLASLNAFASISADDQHLAYLVQNNPNDLSMNDIVTLNLQTGAKLIDYHNTWSSGTTHFSLSGDGRYVGMTTQSSARDISVYVFDSLTGKYTLIAHDTSSLHGNPVLLSNDATLFSYNNPGSFLATLYQNQPDDMPPVVTGTPDRAANAAGWYNKNVTVTWSATDPAPSSGTPTTPAPTVASTEGTHTYTSDPSCDPAGICATGSLQLSIDKTAPTASGAHMSTQLVLLNSPVTVSATAGDALSGVAGGEYYVDTDPGQGNGHAMTYSGGTISTTGSLSGLSIGAHTMYVRSRDVAGNWSAPVSVGFIYI